MNLAVNLLEYNNLGPFDIIEWSLLEDTGWSVGETKAYRKGFKKYQTDKRVMQSLKLLIAFITDQNKRPPITEYPSELYVHPLVDNRFAKGTLWCHLKGQQIGLVFNPDYQSKTLELLALGSHQVLG